MKSRYCCPTESQTKTNDEYEVVRIAKTRNNCRLCDDYAERQKVKPVAVLCCEGVCLRGEVRHLARRAGTSADTLTTMCYFTAPLDS